MKLIRYMGMALAVTAFASCSNEDGLNAGSWEKDSSAVHIKARVGDGLPARTFPGSADKDMQQAFAEGDRINVQAGKQAAMVYTLSGGTWTPPSDESYLKWDQGAEMNFKAFYPVTPGTSMTDFTLPADQSDEHKIAEADYMTFEGNIKKTASADLQFVRRTARIMVKLKFNSEFSDTNIRVSDVKIKGNSRITGSGASNLVYFSPCEADGYTYIALVAPNASKSDKTFFISLKVNDSKFSIQGLPIVEAGKSYTYNLKVGGLRAEVESVTVAPWDTNDLGITNGELSASGVELDAVNQVIVLPHAGSVSSALVRAVMGDDRRLTVRGEINDADIQIMMNLVKVLDISGTTVSGNKIGHYSCQRSSLVSIKLPQSLTEIGRSAFQNSQELEEVVFDDGGTTLDLCDGLFKYCSKLARVVLPDHLTRLDANVFKGTVLTSLTINAPCVASLGSAAFTGFTNAQNCVLTLHESWFAAECPAEKRAVEGQNVTWMGMTWKEVTKYVAAGTL